MASNGGIPTQAPQISTTPIFESTTTSTDFSLAVSVSASTSSHSSSSSVTSTSSTLSTTSVPTNTPTQAAVYDPNTATTNPGGSNVGLVTGIVVGILALLALVLFLVRYMFIRHRHQHRESGQRLAYSKARYAISAPTNFTVLESGTFGGYGIERPGTSQSTLPSLEDSGNGGSGDRVGSPERMRERYPFEVVGLESGLKDQMQTMKTAQLSSRKPVPVYTVEVDTR